MSVSRVRSWSRLLVPAVLLSMLTLLGIGSRAVAMQVRYEAVELPDAPPAAEGPIAVMIELTQLPTARIYANVLETRAAGRSLSAADRRAIEAEAGAAAVAHAGIVLDEQERVAAALPAVTPDAVELYRVHRAFNGIAVLVSAEQMRDIRGIPGVRSVRPIDLDYPNNSTSVPFLGTPQVWDAVASLGLALNADGTGISIGIIDSGVDYLHPDFGGTGVMADYTGERTDTGIFTTLGTGAFGSYPTAKVVGGTDFVGDAYNAGTVPVPTPDANPMDCLGHGSHVAGTAAGFGVTSAGVAYAGPYTPAAVPALKVLKVGPGTAPRALVYALRVFGCGGATAFTTSGIDWAMDPNNDNDLSDHLDVINMSLGSNYGSRFNSSAIASDNAAAIGVIVVASAGNSGDTFFVTGSPGAGTRVLSTAASTDSGISFGAFGTLRVNTPAGIAGNYQTGTAAAFADGPQPPPGGLTGNVIAALDPADGAGPLTTDGCSALTNAAAVAGNIAIIDRGTCGFAVKVKNAQNAGATGVIIHNSAAGAFGNMAGFDETITVPAVMVTNADGTTMRTNIATLNVTIWSAADIVAAFTSRGPRRASSPVRLKPDIAAPGLFINSVQTGITCTAAAQGCITPNATGFLTGLANQVLNLSGTSMAAPHMAGIMALLRQLHPLWTVEELKALAMNYATENVYNDHDDTGPRHSASRVGAGRVVPAASATGNVISMDTDLQGVVNVSYDSEVFGVVNDIHKLRIVNHGTTSQTYDLAIDTVVDSPGVGFSLPGGSSVTVPAGDTVEIDVRMDADASLMDHSRDPLVTATQLPAGAVGTATGPVSRAWLTEESAFVTFEQAGNLKLRVPVYMGSRPASAMTAPDTITAAATSIPLSGTGVCTGAPSGSTCTGVFPTDEVSLVSPFELQAVSPANPSSAPPYADIQYAGVSWNGTMLMFGISTVGDWSSPNEMSVNVCIDNNEDGTYDFLIFNSNGGTLGGSTSPQDTYIVGFRNLTTGATSLTLPPIQPNLQAPALFDSAHLLNNVMFLPMVPSVLGFAGGDTTFRWKVVTCPGGSACARSVGANDHCSPAAGTFFDSVAGPFFFNWAAPGLNFSGATLLQDLNGASIPVTVNTANMTTNGSLGALLLHHHNTAGTRAEVVVLDTAQRADLSITKTASPASPNVGQNLTYTLTVTNNGPNNATGVEVDDFPPLGTTYISDDGAGAYNPALGIWTVGALANGASAVLNIVVSVDISDELCNLAQITGGSPLDPDPSDNQVESCKQAPRTADLAVTVTRTSAATVNPGGTVNWTVTVTNNGDDPAYALTTSESFSPVAVTAGGATATDGVFTPAPTGTWKISSLGPGVTHTLQYSITAPNMAGVLTNTASTVSTKSLSRAFKAFDPNLPDNTDSDVVTVLSPSVIGTITKTVSGSFIEGGTVTYTVTIPNTGSFDQQDNPGFEFTDTLPSQLTLVSATDGASPGTFSNLGNIVNWDGSIPASGSVTITITATINAGTALQTVSNQGTVNHDNNGDGTNEAANLTDDPGQGGAADPTTFVVVSPASIGTHSKTVSGSFQEGGSITYTVTISNPSANTQLDNPGDEFIDVLPSSLTLVSATASSGVPNADTGTNTVTWNGTIAANGGSVTITINAVINNGAGGQTITNQGTINFDADGNGTNESTILTDDPAAGGASDPTAFVVLDQLEIPALSTFGLAVLALLLASGALVALRRRRV